MKRHSQSNRKKAICRLGVLAMASALSFTAYGQATVNPNTQPFLTLAPYVLKSSNLEPRIGNEDGGTRAYRPWFENGAWTGDLIEYVITRDGVRLVRNDVGLFPRNGPDWRGTQQLWSARYAFPDFQPYDAAQEADLSWECQEEQPLYWQNRNIFTLNGGVKTAFRWHLLSTGQRQALDSGTAALQAGDASIIPAAWDSPILNYVIGDRSLERCKQDGRYRWRFSLLGAIMNSRPAYVPVGTDGLVVVGANDGMVHGFSATDGAQVFGYIPSLLIDRVGLIREPASRPRFLVDGELRHRDIGTAEVPRHIVAGGLGAGGRGLFVLDVSTPTNPVVVAEMAGTAAGHLGGAQDPRIGYIHGRPNIARLPDGTVNEDGTRGSKWFVVSGNGYSSQTGTAQLVLIPLDGTPNPQSPSPQFIPTDATANNGLSAPALLDANGNGVVDYAYAGDLQGNLWRFNFNTGEVRRLFAAGNTKPITVEPDIARHPVTEDGFMVYFGTGSLLSGADVSVTSQQTMYGIWDRAPESPTFNASLPIPQNRLVTQTLTSAEVTWTIPQTGNLCATEPTDTQSAAVVRFITNTQQPNWTGATPTLGWQVHLPRSGERIIGHPQVRAERIQFVSTNPLDMVNPPEDPNSADAKQAGSWMLQLDLATGSNATQPRALFDLNKNCTLDAGDGAPEGAQSFSGASIPLGLYPVGVNLGPFHIAQPAFARVRFDPTVRSVVDGVYINALLLPVEEPPEFTLHGPIDVTTDSPNGPAHSQGPEPTKSPFNSRPFPQSSGPTKPYIRQDGLGHRVDGHSFGYNKQHGVNYVDLINLEPRRGLPRLDVGTQYIDSNGNYRPIIFTEDSPSQLRNAHRELNRVTEVGIADNQRFIIVLSNADLSRGNEITIGCRTWPVYAYQTKVMQHLRSANPMTGLVADGLVFTLSGDYNPIRPANPANWQCPNPTLRITPTQRVGSLDALMGTLPGCVTNTNYYESPVNNNPYATRKATVAANGDLIPPATAATLYRTDPHATPYPSPPGNQTPAERGYRWRNGALTVQLLAVNSNNTAAFTIQDAAHLPRPSSASAIEGVDVGFGGAYAKAFNVVVEGSGNNAVDVLVPINNPPAVVGNNSGMLYELSMFWHWGDMARFQSSGQGSPVVPICYGTRQYVPSLARETDWFTPGAYGQLTADLTGTAEKEALQDEYARLVAQLSLGIGDLNAALIRLAEILASSPKIADYHRLRHYVPNSKQLRENHLIRIDRANAEIDVSIDGGTPVQVIDIERDLLPSLGPNYQPGRRSWIDLTPGN